MIDISVIIPTYNRKDGLVKCITSLAGQSYPQDKFEIIVIDDGSHYPTEDILGLFRNKIRHLRHATQDHKGPAAARNMGVSLSSGSIVAFIDDDCEAHSEWLALMVRAHQENPGLVAIGGATLTANQKASVIVGQFLSTCSIEVDLFGKNEIIFFPTCNVSCKRSLFFSHKFDEGFPLPGGEDLEFFWRLFRDGYRFGWKKEIQVIHYRDASLGSFTRQAYIYGRGNLLVKYLHPDHILLKELKTGGRSFWTSTLINFLKIPRFCYLLSKKLLREYPTKNFWEKVSVAGCFALHKMFYLGGNIAEFLKIQRGKETFISRGAHVPRLLILDLTHACNLQCRICDIWKTAAVTEDIDTSAVKKLLGEAQELGVKEIALSGGEVLLRKDIFEIFDHARSLGIKDLGVLSNGIIIKDCLERLKPYLLDRTVSLVVSLDSLSAALHNEIRNSSEAWQRTHESLRLLAALKKDHPDINFNVISIILDQNLEELCALAEFVRSLGANSLQFQALLSNNLKMAERKRSKYWISEERAPVLKETLAQLIRLKNTQPDFIKNSAENLSLIEKYYQGSLSSRDVQCVSAAETVLISNKGEYATCFSIYGDSRKQSFKDVLTSKKRIAAQARARKCPWPCLLPCFAEK
jgi:MoaA/NifB/PqqE/SkfB family radical SAM enzyme/glycosyltransferase involved in cell wall biosynthesis